MSAFDTPWFNSQDRTFFNSLNKSKEAHVILTAETEDFAEEVVLQWRASGFHVVYVPLLEGGNDYISRVKQIGDAMGASEQYAIVAYGDAASLIMEAHTKPNTPKLCSIVAYYPCSIPPTTTKYPASVRVLVHLAGKEITVKSSHQVLGLQSSKKKSVRKRIDPGVGAGECLELGVKAYTYSTCESGFAEHDLDEYDAIAERLAFDRSVEVVKKAFRIEEEVDLLRDKFTAAIDAGNGAAGVRDKMLPNASVVCAPTLVGGIGTEELDEFYSDLFTPLPRPFARRLLSRTCSMERVVDELYLSFTHSVTLPWLLPGVPATNKKVEIALVSIMALRGRKVESERLYWDQASVLLQVGLINVERSLLGGWKKKGVKQLPIVGAAGARVLRDGDGNELNELLDQDQ